MTIPQLENLNFKIVIPQAATNLCTNPSFETNTTGHTAVGGATLTRVATKQRRGAWALRITPVASTESGDYHGDFAVTSGVAYVFSVDVWGVDGQVYALQIKNTSGTQRATLAYTGTGRWDRIELTFTATATESWRLYVVRDSGETGTDYFYIDGLQFETGSVATTYFDGDSVGFVRNQKDFGWNGTRHGSTSYRTAKTRAGGSLLDMSDYCTLAGVFGLGMNTFTQYSTNLISGGAEYQGFTDKPRTFSLLVHYIGSMSDMWDKKNAILNAIRPDYAGAEQPMVLRFQGTDSSGNKATEPLDIVCIPQVSHTDPPQTPALQEDILTFQALGSLLHAAYQEGVELDFADNLTNTNYIIYKDSDGNYSNMLNGMNDTVLALAIASNGDLYAGGAFTIAGGVTANHIAKWDGSAWSALGSGINGSVSALAIAPNGDLYAGGYFTTAGGLTVNNIAKWNGSSWSALGSGTNDFVGSLAIASNGDLYAGGDFTTAGGVTVNYIARWNGSSWSALGSGMNSGVYALAIASNGDLYAGGAFTTAGGVMVNKIAKWNGSSWSALGSGMNAGVYALAIAPNGDLYAGGAFTTAGGVTANKIAKWNESAWSALGSGMNGGVYALAIASNGDLYAGGAFTTAGGVTIYRIAKWNGSAWSALGSGMNNDVRALAIAPNGDLYAGGYFTTAGDLALTDRMAIYRDGVWISSDVDLPFTAIAYAITILDMIELYIGFNSAGTATISGIVSADNGGGASVYPQMTIYGPGNLRKLVNNTTGAQIIFNDLTLLTGEVLTIDFKPGNLSVSSTFRGNLLHKIAPGSDKSTFYLLKGDNSISLLMTGTDGDTEAAMYWTPLMRNIEASRYE